MPKSKPLAAVGSPLHVLMQYGLMTAGSLIIALSFNWFLFPNKVASGGVSGISTIAASIWPVAPALVQWALNIPLFLLGLWLLGGRFGIKTAVGSIVLPLFVLLTSGIAPLTGNILLATIFGGVGVGIGLGLVFRGQASTGGLDVAAQIIHRYTGLSLGVSIALLDGTVILSAGLIFGPEKALWALIGLFVTSKTIDIVQVGFSTSKVAYIVSDHAEAVTQAVLYDLDRGLTRLAGEGGFTGASRPVLMVVVGQREVSRLKAIVKAADPAAFVIITDAAEVLGEGFKLHE